MILATIQWKYFLHIILIIHKNIVGNIDYFFFMEESTTHRQNDVIYVNTIIWRIIICFSYYRRVTLRWEICFVIQPKTTSEWYWLIAIRGVNKEVKARGLARNRPLFVHAVQYYRWVTLRCNIYTYCVLYKHM
jgi:hypothetical protein